MVERIEGEIAYIKGEIGIIVPVPISELKPLDNLEVAYLAVE